MSYDVSRDPLHEMTIRVKNYKCFGDQEQSLGEIKPVNVIIGRNNSGKSALLEVLEFCLSASGNDEFMAQGHRGKKPEVFLSKNLSESELKSQFKPKNMNRNVKSAARKRADDPEFNHRVNTDWDFAANWEGEPIVWRVPSERNQKPEPLRVEPEFGLGRHEQEYVERIFQHVENPLHTKHLKKLEAERELSKETSASDLEQGEIKANGSQCTRFYQGVVHKTSFDETLVEDQLLNELNEIFYPESKFNQIRVLEDGGDWEIYLEENDERYALSHVGSGLQTVLLVLGQLFLEPSIKGNKLSEYIFAFEELENNLHPALQRRLFTYLRDIAIEKGCHFFLTTHSNVVVDLFSEDEHAKILHVQHDGASATVKEVSAYPDSTSVLDDLDVRASDLLQSNCVVWVEGPTDRLYFNRWIELWTDGDLREGAHFQCVFYGGKLLSHLTVDPPDEEVDKFIELLRVNRHPILLMDSDISHHTHSLNDTKERIIDEVKEIDGITWVTAGREIENYLTRRSIYELFEIEDGVNFHDRSDVFTYLRQDCDAVPEDKQSILRSKMRFASEIVPHIRGEDIQERYDMPEKLDQIEERIRDWNGMSD